MQRTITPKGFRELQAYYSIYPHWTERLEVYLTQIAWWVSNSIERKEGTKLPEFKDFLFDFEDIEEKESGSNRQSSKAMERILTRAAKIYGKHQQNINVDNGEREQVQ